MFIVKKKSSRGNSVFQHTITFEISHAKTYAASVLLKDYYYELDETNLKSRANRMKMIGFSRAYLKRKKRELGSLVCTYCNKPNLTIEFDNKRVPNHKKATIDHIIPTSKGGAPFDYNNITVACGRCNSKKSDMSVEEFKSIVKPYRIKK